MKKIMLFACAAIISLGAISCSDEDNNPSGTTTAKLRETLNEGEWRVSSLIKDNSNLTADFTGFAFDFNNGVVTATSGSDILTGSYAVANQTSSSAGHKVVHMYFADEPDFAILNDHWRVIERTDEKITFKYIDEDSEDDTMILEKN